VTIRHAALHNEDDIRRKDIREGDWVYIQRAGEVIPEVIGPILSKRTGQEKEFNLLDKVYDKEKGRPACPECGAEVIRPEDEVMYYCSNAACPAQAHQRIEHFVSRGAMDIRGIGESLSATLLQEGLVKDAADLYYLKDIKDKLVNLDKMAEKSVGNMLDAIENSKGVNLSRFILALGIRHVGGETANLLAEAFTDIDEIADASRDRLMEIPSIGPKIADSIMAFFKQEENRAILKKLRDAGVWPVNKKAVTDAQPLSGLEFVITGRLEAFTRQEGEAQVKALGGTAKDNVTRNTRYLVVGEDPGSSKLNRALTLGTEQINEEKFLALLEEKE